MQRVLAMGLGRVLAVLVVVVSCGEGTRPPVATRLAFDGQPSNAIAGAAIAPQVRVRVLDASGNVFTGATTVTLSLESSNGATLAGTTSAVSASGVAVFPDLRIVKAGAGYMLKASAGGLTEATSNPFDVTHAVAAKLRFVDQPNQASAGKPLSPPVTVEILDQYDNRATSATNAVTVAVASASAGGVLTGTATVDPVSGLATFDRITLNAPGSFTLQASAAGMTNATSASFAVQRTLLARFCPADVATGAAFDSFLAALSSTEPGGTIVICDGTHRVGRVVIDRPVTIAAEHAHAATLTAPSPDQEIFWVREAPPGTYAFRDLSFVVENSAALVFGTGPLNPPVGRYDQVVIENNRFSMTGTEGSGVWVASSSIGTARVIVRGNTFTGGARGVRAEHARAVEIRNNSFQNQTAPGPFIGAGSIELLNGGPYVVRDNVLTDCSYHCIEARSAEADISDNTLKASTARENRTGVHVVSASGPFSVNRNVLLGGESVANRNDGNTYGFKWAGIFIELAGSPVTVDGNSITNANHGIESNHATVIGRNNTVRLVQWAVGASPEGPMLHRNDFLDYIYSFRITGAPPTGPPPLGYLTCNYWGTENGPPPSPDAPANGYYTPFSRVPIAGKTEAEVKCP